MKRSALCSALLAAALVLGMQLQAAAAATSTAGSGAKARFEAGSGKTDPVDPENPPHPGPGPGTGQEGDLTIDYVPDLNFGTDLEIMGVVHTYPAQITGTDVGAAGYNLPFLQVTDRRGTFAGWSVRAVASAFTADDGGQPHVLAGAKIEFGAGRPNSEIMGTPGVMPPRAPAFTLECTGDESQHIREVFAAEAPNGAGTWINRWYESGAAAGDNKTVGLVVPGGRAKALLYEATINWELHNTP